MNDEKNEMNNEPSNEIPTFVHQDGQPELQGEPMAEKKKRSKWFVVGIVLLVVIGIPLVLAGTCLLIITLSN
jgi:hypothetical protein